MARTANEIPAGTVYFSAADRQTECFVDRKLLKGVFENSLIHSLLFDDAILIPDIFHFISNGLYAHMSAHSARGTTSLLEAAVADGKAIPSFRRPGMRSFAEANELVESMGLYGLLGSAQRLQIATRLDAALKRGDDEGLSVTSTWPTHSVGERYGTRLRRFLRPDLEPGGADTPPVSSPAVRTAWENSRLWRTLCLDEAFELAPAAGGFRRGDYMAALGRALGIEETIHDMSQLLEMRLPSEKGLAMRTLCLWINESYHYNQAKEFGLDPNWSRFYPDISMATLAAMERIDPDAVAGNVIEKTVVAKLPPPAVLAEIDGTVLLAVRNGTAGQDFFSSVTAWRAKPDDTNEREVQKKFGNYAAALRNAVNRQRTHPDGLVQLGLGRLDAPSRGLILAAGPAIDSMAHRAGVSAAPFVVVGGIAWTSYVWLTERSRRTSHRIRRPIEVNLA